MPLEIPADLPPLDDLDDLDRERAADMVYNRPQYRSDVRLSSAAENPDEEQS